MKRLSLLFGLLAAVLLVSPATAQTLYVHGGAGFPSSTAFNDAYKTGFNVGAAIGVPITRQLEAVLMGRYDRFGSDVNLLDDFSSYSATGNLKVNAPMMRGRVMPYALGGAGLFRLGIEDAFETEFGLQFGTGLSVRTSQRVNLLVEPNYILVLNEGENTQYFPIRIGASYRL
jgi:hypothetical protein